MLVVEVLTDIAYEFGRWWHPPAPMHSRPDLSVEDMPVFDREELLQARLPTRPEPRTMTTIPAADRLDDPGSEGVDCHLASLYHCAMSPLVWP